MKRFSKAFILMEVIIAIAVIAIALPVMISVIAISEKKYTNINYQADALEMAQLVDSDLWNADLKGVNGMDESNFKGLYSRKIIKEFTSGLRRIQIQIFRWNEKDPQSTPQMILDTWVQTNGSR